MITTRWIYFARIFYRFTNPIIRVASVASTLTLSYIIYLSNCVSLSLLSMAAQASTVPLFTFATMCTNLSLQYTIVHV